MRVQVTMIPSFPAPTNKMETTPDNGIRRQDSSRRRRSSASASVDDVLSRKPSEKSLAKLHARCSNKTFPSSNSQREDRRSSRTHSTRRSSLNKSFSLRDPKGRSSSKSRREASSRRKARTTPSLQQEEAPAAPDRRQMLKRRSSEPRRLNRRSSGNAIRRQMSKIDQEATAGAAAGSNSPRTGRRVGSKSSSTQGLPRKVKSTKSNEDPLRRATSTPGTTNGEGGKKARDAKLLKRRSSRRVASGGPRDETSGTSGTSGTPGTQAGDAQKINDNSTRTGSRRRASQNSHQSPVSVVEPLEDGVEDLHEETPTFDMDLFGLAAQQLSQTCFHSNGPEPPLAMPTAADLEKCEPAQGESPRTTKPRARSLSVINATATTQKDGPKNEEQSKLQVGQSQSSRKGRSQSQPRRQRRASKVEPEAKADEVNGGDQIVQAATNMAHVLDMLLKTCTADPNEQEIRPPTPPRRRSASLSMRKSRCENSKRGSRSRRSSLKLNDTSAKAPLVRAKTESRHARQESSASLSNNRTRSKSLSSGRPHCHHAAGNTSLANMACDIILPSVVGFSRWDSEQ